MSKIVFATDNRKEFVDLGLKLKINYGYEVLVVHSKKEVFECLQKEVIDVLVLDLEMTNIDAIIECSEIKKNKNISQPFIIIASEKTADHIQALAFDSGADDFLLKPLKFSLIAVRVKAMLKRKGNSYTSIFSGRKKISMNKEKHQVLIDEKEIILPRKEFNLLYLLYSNPEKIFSRTEIAKHIWGDVLVGERERRTIDVHLSSVRSKIGNDYIRTISGIGYIFNL